MATDKKVIDGENTGEVMNPGYTDANGDSINNASNTILGNGGDDSINAGDGDDIILGGSGNDTIAGGQGSDLIYGDNSNQSVANTEPTILNFDQLAGGRIVSNNGAIGASVQLNGFSQITSNYTAGKATPESGLFAGEHSGQYSADFAFDHAVSNLNFTIYDVNEGASWDDRVQIIALDANGNQVPVNFYGENVATGGVLVGGNVVEGENNNTTYSLDSNNPDNVEVNIQGPIVALQVIHVPGDSSNTTGWIGISDMHVSAAGDIVIDSGTVNGTFDDVIDGGEGDDIIIGDSVHIEPTSYVVDLSNFSDHHAHTAASGNDSIGLNIDTPLNGAGKGWSVHDGLLRATYVEEPTAANINFEKPVSNVAFTLRDVDGLDEVRIIARDADGNEVPVSFENTGLHAINGNTVTGTQTNNPGVVNNNNGQDINVQIAGPIASVEFILDNGPERSYSGEVAVDCIKFDVAPLGTDNGLGDDIINGGAGDDVIYGDNAGSPSTGGINGLDGNPVVGGSNTFDSEPRIDGPLYGRFPGTVYDGLFDFSSHAFYLGDDIGILDGANRNELLGATFSHDGVGTNGVAELVDLNFTGAQKSFVGLATVQRTALHGANDQFAASNGDGFQDVVIVNDVDVSFRMNDGTVFQGIRMQFLRGEDGKTYLLADDHPQEGTFNSIRTTVFRNDSGIESFQIESSSGNINGINPIVGNWAAGLLPEVLDPLQPADGEGGDDIITGGEGADLMFGQGGNDTFIVGSETEGAGDVIVGGNGPNQNTDYDVLDLRGAGPVTIEDAEDVNDAGARAGTVTFENGATLEFSQIEAIITDDTVLPTLTIEAAPGTPVDDNGNPITEENGQPTFILVSRSGPTDEPLEVTLGSDDPTEATVPQTVTIPAGQDSVIVPVTPIDDPDVDGTQTPTITATAPGFEPVEQDVAVADDDVAETPALTIEPAPGVPVDQSGNPITEENGQPTFILVSRNSPTDEPLEVTLGSDDPTEATVPQTVTIPAGQDSVIVPVTPVDDPNVDGTQTPTITATAPGFEPVAQDVAVADDDVVVNEGPDAVDDDIAASPVDEPVVISPAELLGNDSDPEGDAFAPISVQDPQNGTVAFDGTNVIFTPDAGYEGPASFTYTIEEAGTGKQDTATVNLTIAETPALTIEPAPGVPVDQNGDPITEENGQPTFILVSRNGPTDEPLEVTLGSDDPTEATVPQTVTIPAGQDSVIVPVTPVDDADVDGTQTPTITATAPGFEPVAQDVAVADDDVAETPALTIEPAPGVPVDQSGNPITEENGQPTFILVSRNGPTDEPLEVTLGSDDPTEATVPQTVTIPAGQDSVIVPVTPVDDPNVDGTQTPTITATAPGFEPVAQDVAVADDDVVVNEGPDAVDDDIAASPVDEPVVISPAELLGNDSDPEGDAFAPISVQDPQNGTVAFDGTNVIFTPDAGYEGPASFTYTIEEAGTGKQDTATVNLTIAETPALTIEPAPGVPVDQNGDPITEENGQPTFILVSRNGPTDEPLEVTLGSDDPTEATVPQTVTIPAGQDSVIVPVTPVDDADVDGAQTPTITATAPGFVPATQDVLVNDDDTAPQNQDPDAIDDTVSPATDGIVTINPATLLANDTDPDGDDLQGVSVQDPVNGTVAFDGTSIIFTPTDGYTGPASFTYTITDGNGGTDTATVDLVVDGRNTPEAPTNAPDMTAPSDTGVSDVDDLTGDDTPSFSIDAPGDNTPVLYVDGQPVPSTYDPVTQTLTPDTPLSEGPHDVTYTLESPEGVQSAPSPSLPVVIDTTAPETPDDAPDMTAATDTGPSDTDDNTGDSTPDFAIDVPADTTPVLYVDGVETPSIYNPVTGNLTPSQPLSEGPHDVTYTLKDPAGNESAPSPVLPVVIGAQNQDPDAVDDTVSPATDGVVTINPATLLANDTDPDGDDLQGVSVQDPVNGTVAFDGTSIIFTPTDGYTGPASFTYTITDGNGGTDTATVDLVVDGRNTPEAPTNAPDMTAPSDTGVSDVDDLTGDDTPSFSIDAPGDNTPVLYVDGQPVPSTYDPVTQTLTPDTPLSEGPHDVTYTLESPEGVQSAPSPSLPVVIDTTAPETPDDAPDMTAATDSGVSDTDDNTNDSTPNFAVEVGAGETPELYIDGQPVEATFDPVNNTMTPVLPMADGPHEVSYRLVDAAGNPSELSDSLPVVIDTTAPAAGSAADMTPETDTGVSDSDDYTSQTTPDFAIDAVGDNTPTLYIDGVKITSTFDAAANTLTPVGPLPDGVYEISYTLTDPAGNESVQSEPLAIEVNQTPLNQNPDAIDDNLTDDVDGAVVIDPARLLANDTDPDGDALQGVSVQDPVNGTVAFDGTNIIFTPTAGYAGVASFTYTVSDGNGGFDTASVDLVVNGVVDPTAPAAPTGAPDMTPASDTGISNEDDITADTTPSFAVEDPGANTPVLYVDGVEVPSVYDPVAQTVTPVNPIGDGPHAVTYTFESPEGLQSAPSPSLPVVIDTTAPTLTPTASDDPNATSTAPDMTPETDTGISNTDDLTADNTPSFMIGAVGDATPTLYINRAPVTAEYDAVNNTLTPTGPLPDGVHEVVYTLTDAAGNESLPSDALPFSVDTTAPSAPTTTPDMTPATDTGISNSDDITADTTPSFTIGDVGGNTPVLYVDGVEVPAVYDPTAQTLTPANPVAEGSHEITYTLKDPAGNESAPSPSLAFVIDTTPVDGQNLVINGSFEDVTGMSQEDFGFQGDGEIPNWTDRDGYRIDVHNDSRGGLDATDGNNWLDLGGVHANNHVVQTINGVQDAQTYQLTFDAGDIRTAEDGQAGDNTLTVIWGGQVIAEINPADGEMNQYTFNVIGGAGDGNNRLEFKGEGQVDNFGVSLDKIRLVSIDGNEGAPNNSPDAHDDALDANQGNVLVIDPATLLANDVDADGDALQGVGVQDPVNGTVAFDGSNVIFTPTDGYTGPASFTYTVSDGKGGFDSATVNLTVEASGGSSSQNQAPVANDDQMFTTLDGQYIISKSTLLGNDYDPDGDPLTVTIDAAQNGTMTVDGDHYVFQANDGYTGPASFTYTVSDGNGGSDTATVNVNVLAQDTQDFPEGVVHFNDVSPGVDATPPEGWYSDNPGGVIEVLPSNLYGLEGPVSNIMEIERNPGDASNFYTLVDSAENEMFTLDFDYSSRPNFEGGENSAVQIVVDGEVVETINASAAGFAPYSVDIPGTGEEMRIEFRAVDQNEVGGLLDNIALSKVFVNQPVTDQPDDQPVTDVPVTGQPDGETQNTAPEVNDDTISTAPSDVILIDPATLLANDTDADGDALQGVSVQGAVNGQVAFDGQNIRFTPFDGYEGPASFTYTVSDGNGGIETATVNLIIETLAPVGNQSADVQLVQESIDLDMSDLSIGLNSNLAGGWVTDNAGGQVEINSSEAYGVPGEAHNVMELARYEGEPSNIYTTINAEAGQVVNLSFDYSARAGEEGTDSAINVLVNGEVVETVSADTVGFNNYQFSFNATGEPMRVELQAVEHDSRGGLIDQLHVDYMAVPNQVSVNLDMSTIETGLDATLPDGWATDNPGGFVEVDSSSTYGIPGEARNVMELARYEGDASNIYSTVTGELGTLMTLSFDYSARAGHEGADSAVNVLVNGEVIDTVSADVVGMSNYQFTFSATGEPMRVELQATDSDSNGGLVDNIQINSVAPAVRSGSAPQVDEPIVATEADDNIQGTERNETIDAGAGDDLVAGGAGNDTLTGGVGADTFSFELSDTVAPGVEHDVITDFSGEDAIDLKDLLSGESQDAESLASYIHFTVEDGSTTMHVSANGEFAAGASSTDVAGTETQQIEFAGVDLTAGGSMNDMQVIQNLLSNNQLITD